MDLANWITSPYKYFNNGEFMEQCFAAFGSLIKSCHIKDVFLKEELISGEFGICKKVIGT